MNEDKATRYQRLRRRASLAQFVAQAALLAVLAATPLSVTLRSDVVSLVARWPVGSSAAAVVTVLLFAVAVGLLSEGVGLTAGFYRTHLLERRYGLTEESRWDWASGHLKASLLRLAMWAVAGLGMYGAMWVAPGVWWALAAGAFTVASLVATNLAPLTLLPVFYDTRPLTREPLRARLVTLACRAGAGQLGIHEWTLGERTRRANAALVGIGPTRRILLSDTLLNEYSDAEIEVVFAHELAHHHYRDAWKMIAVEGALVATGLLLADWLVQRSGWARSLEGPADVAGMPVLVLVAGAAALVLAPAVNALARRFERRADRYALEATRNPGAFVSALRRLAAQHLVEDRPSRVTDWWLATHPSPADRIAAASAFRATADAPSSNQCRLA